MYTPGLVSVTFRKLTPKEILALMTKTELRAVEWGGDVHVPDAETASEVRRMSADAGVTVASYGSYYHCGEEEPFGPVLKAAVALGAPNIRVWAGNTGSLEADLAYREKVAADARMITSMAMSEGVSVAFEFHGGTLTDTTKSTLMLLDAAKTPGLSAYWQPPQGSRMENNLTALDELLPSVSNIHCFEWRCTNGEITRRPFAEGEAHWRAYFQKFADAGKSGCAFLEFVKNDSTEQLIDDAAALCVLLKEVQG